MQDERFAKFAAAELAEIEIIEPDLVEDFLVVRESKTYPGYFGSYDRFNEIRDYVDTLNIYF
jgi:hypothetical protein